MEIILMILITVCFSYLGWYLVNKIKLPRNKKSKPIMLANVLKEPDGFYNLVKEFLPKDKGLIYEVESVQDRYCPETGRDAVRVKAFDMSSNLNTDEPLFVKTFNESSMCRWTDYAWEVKSQIKDSIEGELLRMQKKNFLGTKDIVF